MSNLMEFLRQPSPGKQNLKTVIIGLAVLIAAIAATITVSWITSQAKVVNAPPTPLITVQMVDNILIAEADIPISTWQYVGPKRQDTCQDDIFRDALGFKSSFKHGNRVSLNQTNDQSQYYCFRAISVDGVSGFATYLVPKTTTVTTEIIIEFNQGQLIARLSPDIDPSLYTSNWQHLVLFDQNASCDQAAFANPSFIQTGSSIPLAEILSGSSYCFRVMKNDGSYVYKSYFTQ